MLKHKLFSDAGNGNPPPKDPPPIKDPKDGEASPLDTGNGNPPPDKQPK